MPKLKKTAPHLSPTAWLQFFFKRSKRTIRGEAVEAALAGRILRKNPPPANRAASGAHKKQWFQRAAGIPAFAFARQPDPCFRIFSRPQWPRTTDRGARHRRCG